MKVALCFIISYDHVLHKESIWKKWIHANQDIIHVYFHYTQKNKIQSEWILEHCIPEERVSKHVSYYHMMDAYLSIAAHAYQDDTQNTWFCFLTDSCVPLISPLEFRLRFFKNQNKSIMCWKKAWWNVQFHKRANLRFLHETQRLANDPWFVMTRYHVSLFLRFPRTKPEFFSLVCSGGLANESLFAIMYHYFGELKRSRVINEVSTLTNWENMSSATSPYVFKTGDGNEIAMIENGLNRHPYVMFMRKVAIAFPDDVLMYFIEDKYGWKQRVGIQMMCCYYQYKNRWFYILCFLLFSYTFCFLDSLIHMLEGLDIG